MQEKQSLDHPSQRQEAWRTFVNSSMRAPCTLWQLRVNQLQPSGLCRHGNIRQSLALFFLLTRAVLKQKTSDQHGAEVTKGVHTDPLQLQSRASATWSHRLRGLRAEGRDRERQRGQRAGGLGWVGHLLTPQPLERLSDRQSIGRWCSQL